MSIHTEHFRKMRDEKLEKSDGEMMKLLDTATSWSDFSTIRAEWKTYRQALRDLPSTFPEEMDETNLVEMPLSPTEQAAMPSEE